MKVARLIPVILILSLSLALYPASATSGYVPHQGDNFSYSETIDVNGGTGSYQGYSDHTVTTGSESMNTLYPNGTVASHYGFTWVFTDSNGGSKNGGSKGNFTWSSVNFAYERGTDNQTGVVNPKVWFFMDNSTAQGGSFYMLDTLMTVQSRSYGFLLPSQNKYINTIFAQGSSSYLRSDSYGQFNAQYTWSAYFDPLTGYIVGYVWSEHDTSGADGFTFTESLGVTQTSYPLTAGTAPSNLLLYVIVAVVVAFILIVIIVAAVVIRRSRRLKLPKHAYQQEYRPPMPLPVPQQGIDLTPKQPPAQQIVIKEVVKVNCKYCGALIDSTVLTCPICGAPRT